MADPTRPLPNLVPQPDGSWIGHSMLTPTSLNTRGMFTLPSSKVVPVIVVPGIMGSNLRAATSPAKRANKVLNPGEEAWRAPNGLVQGVTEARLWKNRDPQTRQLILDANTLEVDNRGDISLPEEASRYGTTREEVRKRGWGEVHWDSYGKLLYGLYIGLNHTFEMDVLDKVRVVRRHWREVMDCEPAQWGVRSIEKITEKELEKHAGYYYPVYACGYNWLESCEDSAKTLQRRIEEIIAFWKQCKCECEKVILVTHSMGGLVARACAKQIPDRILGVIHGVMPALGAPACYRRIASGTEKWSPSNGEMDNKKAEYVAQILGERPESTMAVMATAPGALQLLPTHLYPKPWLHVCMVSKVNNKDVGRDVVHLPAGNPYDLYRDMDSWYRLIDPQLADPARKYAGGALTVKEIIWKAIETAERFHRETLDTYYHPNTYVFYGADPAQMSFGAVRWVARDPGKGAVFTEANLRDAARTGYGPSGGRRVRVEGRTDLHFVPARQDVAGDGTVPHQSGAGPQGKVKQVFEIRGFDHQGAFNHDANLLLTHHLIVKMVQTLV
jgi:pimeloyl-ACP methyl ester carboxylesterase